MLIRNGRMPCLLLIVFWCCGSPESNPDSPSQNGPGLNMQNYDTIPVTRPPDRNFVTGRIFIDSVSIIEYDGEPKLKIKGWLPDGCSELYSYDYSIEKDNIHIHMESWRPRDAICTQALVEFTFISDDPESTVLEKLSRYTADDQTKAITRESGRE